MKLTREGQQAFVDRVYEHQGIIWRIRSIYAKEEMEAQDLIQDILLQLWRAWPSFDGRSAFSTWMYRVALNTALMHRRKYKTQPESTAESYASFEMFASAPVPDTEGIRLLYACIRELATLDRAIILLYLEEYNYQEIAEITGLSKSNISVRIVRIKNKLREMLITKGYRED